MEPAARSRAAGLLHQATHSPSMLEQRDLKLDLLALGLLGLTIFLAAALLSYDPADPPSKLVFPERAETLNACGRSGAVLSRVLFGALGLGAYYLVFSLAGLDAVLLARHAITQPVLRAGGWLLSLVGVTTLAAMAVPGLSPGPVIGSGGYLGAAGRGLLEMNFAAVGAYILTLSLIFGGLLLCTDYVLIRILAWAIGGPARSLGRGLACVGIAYAQRLGKKGPRARPRQQHQDLEEDEEEEDEQEVAIRITGRPAQTDAEPGEEDRAAEKGTSRQQPAAKEEAASSAARKPLASMLRMRNRHRPEHRELLEQLEAADASDDAADYELPGMDLLLEGESFCFEEHEKEVRRKAKVLERTFADFGFHVRVVEIQTGPVIAQFEVELEAGLRLSRITGLADDLAIALRVPSVRIVAPIPGKNTVGIEVPNSAQQLVRLREVMAETEAKAQKMRIPIFLGRDVAGNPMVVDLASLPHLLIAGRTGTGKSVCLNSIIVSMLMTRRPDEVRMLLIDPKMVELSPYKKLPHLMHPVVTDMRKAEAILAWAVEKMEQRYELLARAGVRHISVYNQLGEEELMERIQPASDEERSQIPTHMPYVVLVADELADLMMMAAKEVEGHIIRLAQKSRAVGIHLVMATQKPTVDIITGLIKSNLPARICFQVASRTDSRVVLDEMGAEKLLGNGDMLFLWPGTSALIRGQGTYLSDDEISRVISSVATSEPQFVKELVQLKAADTAAEGPHPGHRDDLYEAAVDLVIREGRGSVSLLQRSLGIGYGRAARLIDYMAEDGIVGPYNGSQAREVLMSLQEWEELSGQVPDSRPASPKPRRRNKILLGPSHAERHAADKAPLPGMNLEDTDDADETEEQGELEERGADADDDDQPSYLEEEDEAPCQRESEYEEDDPYDENEEDEEDEEDAEDESEYEEEEYDTDEEEDYAADYRGNELEGEEQDAEQKRWTAESA
jgi:S-DNA-T family DNA segregation ATPase FtsK/SpoIIIE